MSKSSNETSRVVNFNCIKLTHTMKLTPIRKYSTWRNTRQNLRQCKTLTSIHTETQNPKECILLIMLLQPFSTPGEKQNSAFSLQWFRNSWQMAVNP